MTDVDMRKLMETVNQSEQLDEAGGIIDKGMAALGSKGAKGRVGVEKERKSILDGWKEYVGAQGINNKDVEGFKKFLTHWNFDSNEIDDIVGEPFNLKDSLLKAARIQHASGKGVTGAERGGPFKQDKPIGDNPEDIMLFYQKSLGGNPVMLQAEIRSIKNANEIGNDPLGMLGYAFMKAASTGKKKK